MEHVCAKYLPRLDCGDIEQSSAAVFLQVGLFIYHPWPSVVMSNSSSVMLCDVRQLHVLHNSFPYLTKYITCLLFICRAWNSCSTRVQRTGCTFRDLFVQVLQKQRWSYLNTYDLIQQQYKEVIDSLHHLCNNIAPGTNTRHSVSTDYSEVTSVVTTYKKLRYRKETVRLLHNIEIRVLH